MEIEWRRIMIERDDHSESQAFCMRKKFLKENLESQKIIVYPEKSKDKYQKNPQKQ
jgi:hypothetical protein